MTWANEAMREALRDIESRAAAALYNQPENSDECGRHLNKALAWIELKAHVARWGQEGYQPPYNRESPGAGRGIPSTAKRGSESGLQPPSRESVAQAGTRSNTCHQTVGAGRAENRVGETLANGPEIAHAASPAR